MLPVQTQLCVAHTYLKDQFQRLHWLEQLREKAVNTEDRPKVESGQRLSNYLRLILR